MKWSSMRKGEKLRSLAVPIERRTRAPAPSDCSIARKAWRIVRDIDMLPVVAGAKKEGAVKGRLKVDPIVEESL